METAKKLIGDFDVTVDGDRVLIEGAYVQNVGTRSIWIKSRGSAKQSKADPSYGGDDLNIPKSLLLECDEDVDEIDTGDVITFEMPLWKAREIGIAE